MNPHSVAKLEAFFKAVALLTSNHDVIGDSYATVSPAKLGIELEKVDPEWYKISPTTEEEKKKYTETNYPLQK
jgi:hypothetical protein